MTRPGNSRKCDHVPEADFGDIREKAGAEVSINPQDREVVERACALIAGFAQLEAHKHATPQEAEPAKAEPTPKTLTPDSDDGNAMVAQEALDEWRACKQQPKAADWAYRWAVDLCERLGAR